MKTILFVFCLLCTLSAAAQGQKFTIAQYKEDFNFFWTSINDDYAYFNKKQTDWAKVKEMYMPMVDTVSSRASFVSILEQALYEIYDHHASLNTNNPTSQRLVPTGAEVWGEYINGKPIITEVRSGSLSEKFGVTAGMEVATIDGILVEQAIKPFIGKSLRKVDIAARNYALNVALAGRHNKGLSFTVKQRTFTAVDSLELISSGIPDYFPVNTRVDGKIMAGNIGYVKLNNCLGDNDMIKELDSVMQTMKDTKGLILDMRETPSGGNTTVARAILGWFTNKDQFYQLHELYAEEKQTGIKRSWQEIVSPRAGKYYSKPLAILANHWTGSIGEGIVIGFDAMKRATIIGAPMARLNGANYTYTMPNTKINFSFPVERLYHISGTPRELYTPNIVIDYLHLPSTLNNDPALDKARFRLKIELK